MQEPAGEEEEGRVRRGSLTGDNDLSGDFEQWYLLQFNSTKEDDHLRLVASDRGSPFRLVSPHEADAEESELVDENQERAQMIQEIEELVAAGAIDLEKGEELKARLSADAAAQEPPQEEAPPPRKRQLSVFSQFQQNGAMPSDEVAFEELVLKQSKHLCELTEREEILRGEVSIKVLCRRTEEGACKGTPR
eukprot:g1720.t1